MKKLLSFLGAIGLVATSSATVVSCNDGPADKTTAFDLSTISGDKLNLTIKPITGTGESNAVTKDDVKTALLPGIQALDGSLKDLTIAEFNLGEVDLTQFAAAQSDPIDVAINATSNAKVISGKATFKVSVKDNAPAVVSVDLSTITGKTDSETAGVTADAVKTKIIAAISNGLNDDQKALLTVDNLTFKNGSTNIADADFATAGSVTVTVGSNNNANITNTTDVVVTVTAAA